MQTAATLTGPATRCVHPHNCYNLPQKNIQAHNYEDEEERGDKGGDKLTSVVATLPLVHGHGVVVVQLCAQSDAPAETGDSAETVRGSK